MENFSVCNRFGEKTGETIGRRQAHAQGICHRTAQLWIVNSAGQVLLQQRSANKDTGANLWYVSVAGHVSAGECIEDALIREAKEELDLDLAALTQEIEFLYTFADCYMDQGFVDREFLDVFLLRGDFPLEDMILQEEEVQAVRYLDYSNFRNAILQKDPNFWIHDYGFALLLTALDRRL